MNIKRPKNLAETMAYRVAALSMGATAISYESNYCIGSKNTRILFADHGIPAPRMVSERRNPQGRCTRAVYEYADGSTLIFTWSEKRGYHVGCKR